MSGHRHFHDYASFKTILDQFNISEIIVDDATGTDAMARRYSREVLHKEPIILKAKWNRYGSNAGPIRCILDFSKN